MAVEFASREISEKYDRFARWYDWVEGVPNLLGLKRLRRSLLEHAAGRVLEIAVGTGQNFAHAPARCGGEATDISSEMLKVASRENGRLTSPWMFPSWWRTRRLFRFQKGALPW